MLSLAKSSLLLTALASLTSAAAIKPRNDNTCRPPITLNARIILQDATAGTGVDATGTLGWIPWYNEDGKWVTMNLSAIANTPVTAYDNRFHVVDTVSPSATFHKYQISSAQSGGQCVKPVVGGGDLVSQECYPLDAALQWEINCQTCATSKSTGCQFVLISGENEECANRSHADLTEVKMEGCGEDDRSRFIISNEA